MRKILLSLILVLLPFYFAPNTFADNEFYSKYDLNYEVDTTGTTSVNEAITLHNLTDRYYASSYNLIIGATKIKEVLAFDASGPLKTTLVKEGNKTKIIVNFNQQVVGKDKEYTWNLKYKSSDFAEKQGQVWQISIPRVTTTQPQDDYDLVLSIPTSFGDPTSIVPEPISHSETGGKINYHFSKAQISKNGVLANFGSVQLYSFNLGYELTNASFLPTLAQLPLPPDTSYQQVLIDTLDPKPENVTIDGDGNFIAWYKIEPKKTLSVSATGLAKLYFKPWRNDPKLNSDQYKTLTTKQEFWETDNPLIKERSKEIFKDSKATTNKQKADLINQFVVNYLKYNDSRVGKKDFERLGAITALNNPDNALCGEFTDLFIALAREQNIPTRELLGYAYSGNADLRPLSFGSLLHAWPEYYDDQLGWVMIDPTWQNTAGGVDYFNKIDLNHFVLSKRGLSSTEPSPSNDIEVKFSNVEFTPREKASIEINSPSEIFSGLPSKISLSVNNQGNSLLPNSNLIVNTTKLSLSNQSSLVIPDVPPFGHVSMEFGVKPSLVWDSYNDTINIYYKGQKITRNIIIKSFVDVENFHYIILAIILLIIFSYVAILVLHHKKMNPALENYKGKT